MSTLVADTGQGGSVYAMEVSKRYKYGLSLLFFESWLFNIYQHVPDCI